MLANHATQHKSNQEKRLTRHLAANLGVRAFVVVERDEDLLVRGRGAARVHALGLGLHVLRLGLHVRLQRSVAGNDGQSAVSGQVSDIAPDAVSSKTAK